MNVVVPMVAMVFFSALCVGAFAWMRRPEFGEAGESAVRVALSPMKAQACQVEDGPAVGRSPRTIRSPLELSNVEVEKLKEVHS